jgi:protein-tyrosine kinase
MQGGRISAGEVERVLALQRRENVRFGEAALRLGLITAEDLGSAIAKQYGIPQLVPGAGGPSSELVVAYDPGHRCAEELRSLRTQLLIRLSSSVPERRLLAIVSTGAGDGRSYLAANLAVLFAQLGRRTLLIDADLRRPRQHRIFDIPDRVGLSAVLNGRAGCEAVAALSDFGPLSILPAGALPPNPQELLLRPSLASLLEALSGEFDLILLDTPPARLFADAQSVAFVAGNALVLARKDHSRLADTTRLIRGLGDAGARIVGTVFNAH